MSMVDKQRITAVGILIGMGYTFHNGAWVAPSQTVANLTPEADRLHALLVEHADELGGCPDGSPEDAELKSITGALEAYEAKRWPDQKIPGGKG